jgi:methylmalonyl-CoA/ethylmalonyl-CoA epimerase
MNPPVPAPAISRLRQVAINAHDVPAAAAFYRDVLGLKHLFDAGPNLAFFDCGGVRLMITQPSAPKFDHPSSILYFLVPDIEAGHAALERAGATIEAPPQLSARMPDHELWNCFFRDPAGNVMALMCEKRH